MKKILLITLLSTLLLPARGVDFTNGVLLTSSLTGFVYSTNPVAVLTLDQLREEESVSRIHPVQYSTRFRLPHREHVDFTFTNSKSVTCSFDLKWVIETNDSPRECLGFSYWSDTNRGSTLLSLVGAPVNTSISGTVVYDGSRIIFGGECPKEHLDTSDHTVVHYVSSNLVSTLVWRGRTNVNYLESIPLTNITNHWHYEKTQVWSH
jgi:hypothetical protein